MSSGARISIWSRRDGRLILGATVEEKGFDSALTAGGVLALLEAAWRVVPAIEELPVAEFWVGHRPGSRDDAPMIGLSGLPGLVYATGHHRNGILLAPLTADAAPRWCWARRSRTWWCRSALPSASCVSRRRNRYGLMNETAVKDSLEVNGERVPLTARTVIALLEERGIEAGGRGVAIALNGAVLPRAVWGETALKAGDSVEIVQAKQGG